MLPLNRDYSTTSKLISVNIKESDILNILKSLGFFLFENWLRNGIFPDQWKIVNILHFITKGYKQLVKNYGFLLPICEKVFERITFYDSLKHFKENNLLSPHHSVQVLSWEVLVSNNLYHFRDIQSV